jgi:ferrous iron transport protein B
MKKKTIVVGLAGNPNSGKTSIFNALTGARQKVANWSGVTVEKREGKLKYKEYTFKIVDLPGTYSLSSYSIEEIVARDFILSVNPDVIINVVDAGNLDRNLYLTTQLIDMRTKVVMALNMHDEAELKGIKINTEILGALLGMDVVGTIATKSEGIDKLLDAVIDVSSKQSPVSRHIHINYGNDIESEIKKIQNTIRSVELIKEKYSTPLSTQLI